MIATTTAITPNTLSVAASARGMTLSSESTSGSTAHAMSPPTANGNSVGHVATTIPATPRSTLMTRAPRAAPAGVIVCNWARSAAHSAAACARAIDR